MLLFFFRSIAKLPSMSLMKMIEREKPKATPTIVNLPSERGSSPVRGSGGGPLIREINNTADSAQVTDYFADDL